MITNIAIQGYEGSFHQVAAQSFFGKNVKIIPCAGFKEVVMLAAKKENGGGVMAIENSIAGSILPNYNLLQKSDLQIIGEVYLRINQHLLVNPGVQLDDIREVLSHPMAIQQCFTFLDQYKWKLVETDDTALSAKHIQQHRSKHTAAIAGKLAADLYQLTILAQNIQSEKSNYTRFLILQNSSGNVIAKEANKASINFHTNHLKGSLAKVLTVVANEDINLSKLQSFPIAGSNWKYSFHADMEFDDLKQFYKVIEKIKPITQQVKVYGIYKKGITIN